MQSSPSQRTAPLVLATLLLMPLAPLSADEDAEAAPYDLTEVVPGVWAALQPAPLRFADSNSVVIAGEHAALVIDSQSDPKRVAWLARAVEALLDVPVRYLVNTHWHGDHTRGNAAWHAAQPGLVLIGHPTLREEIPGRAEPRLAADIEATRQAVAAAEARLERGVDEDGEPLERAEAVELTGTIERARARIERLTGLGIPLPELTFEERLTVHLGGRRVELRHLPGHTAGDVVAWLPEERVLVTGDLLDALPFGGHGDPVRWLDSLEALDALAFEILVPGHGPTYRGEAAQQQLAAVQRLFTFLVDEAERAVAQGVSLEASLEALPATARWTRHRRLLAGDDLLAGRAFDEFVPETFERAYRQAAEGGRESSGTVDK